MVSHLVKTFITQPLSTLYFNGPTTLGFWGGATPQDICFSLTGTTSSFWASQPEQCTQLTNQKFEAFTTVVMFLFYTLFIYRLFNILTLHVCFTQPVLRELRAMRTQPAPTLALHR